MAWAAAVAWLALVPVCSNAAPASVEVEPAGMTEQMRRQAEGPKRRILNSADLPKRATKSNSSADAVAPLKPADSTRAASPAAAAAAAAPARPAPQDEASTAGPAAPTPSGALPQAPDGEAQRAGPVARGDSPALALAAALPALEEPRLVQRVLPLASEIQDRSGTVTVSFVIQEDGSVTDVAAVAPSDRTLSRIAVAAVRQWRYAPLPARRAHAVKLRFQGSED